MEFLAKIRRGFSIKWRMMLLSSAVVFVTVLFLSTIALNQFQTVLLEKTLDVCRNLSTSISNIAREELLINEIFDATRSAVSRLRGGRTDGGGANEAVTALTSSYVINVDGRIVAHTDEARIGDHAPAADRQYYGSIKKLTYREVKTKQGAVLRFAYPIFIYYRERPLRVGTGVFEFDQKAIYQPIDDMRRSTILVAAALVLGSLLATFVLSLRLSRPIERLADAVAKIADGDLGFQVNISTGGEIGQLARHFNEMSSELKLAEEHRKENEVIKLQQAAISRELEIAQGIQLAVLPRDGDIGPYQFMGHMETADEVGGDYYDCIEVTFGKKKHFWFFVGDVSGHGLQAGLTMLMAQTAIQTAVELRPDLTPAQSVSAINRVLYDNIARLKERKYMTATFFRADTRGRFLAAGLHQDILVYRGRTKKVEQFSSDGMWLGVEEDIEELTSDISFQLNAGDLLFLYTDGITEAINANGEMFGDERVVALLERYGSLDLQTLKNNLLDDLYGHMGQIPTRDDITFAMIRRA